MENNVLQIKIWGQLVGLMYWDVQRKVAVFEYAKEFVLGNLDIAPVSMSIKSARSQKGLPWLGEKEKLFQGLSPVFADSLPDKWGSALFGKWVDQHHLHKKITPIDQLSYIGTRGMGALEFFPAHEVGEEKSTPIDLQELYDFARKVLSERTEAIINAKKDLLWQDLIKIGTSAGGKRPKAVIAYNEKTKEIRSGQTWAPEGFEHYILKFDEQAEIPFTKLEFVYAELARKAGISMMPCQLLENNGRFHFMTERFDRHNNQKVHMQTMAAMNPLSDSYEDIFRVMRILNLPASEFAELYRRMVFNVIGKNTDDHNKNFSFIMSADGFWHLSPAYDLTFSVDMLLPSFMNYHEMSINGKNHDITYEDLENIAKENDIANYKGVIEQVRDAFSEFKKEAVLYDIHLDLINKIQKELKL